MVTKWKATLAILFSGMLPAALAFIALNRGFGFAPLGCAIVAVAVYGAAVLVSSRSPLVRELILKFPGF